MTLQQLRYVTTIANIGSISEAAKRLFVSQPSLTKAIKELEKEMGITIFDRTNKGITVSKDGERFLGYARQVLEQATLLEEQYKSNKGRKKQFSVSTQHYSFAVNAFIDLINQSDVDSYDFSLRETQTYEIIDDVAHMKSEIGLLYYNEFNRPVLEKLIHTNELTFTELFTASPHIFIGKQHPLASKKWSPWMNWSHILMYHLNKVTIIRSTSQKRFSVLLCAQNIYAFAIGPPSLVY